MRAAVLVLFESMLAGACAPMSYQDSSNRSQAFYAARGVIL